MTEKRYTDPKTGAQKGVKPEQYHCIPPTAEMLLARQYAYGSEKYDDHNFRKGIPWSMSYNAMRRHMRAFWDGETYDPETGLPHTVAVAWHALNLTNAIYENPEMDDRYGFESETELTFEEKLARDLAANDEMLRELRDRQNRDYGEALPEELTDLTGVAMPNGLSRYQEKRGEPLGNGYAENMRYHFAGKEADPDVFSFSSPMRIPW